MKKPFLRYDNPLWAFLGALLFLLIFSWSTSPLYKVYGSDSPFFEIIGLGIIQGKIPYVDLFDHKGPIIFFFDALGFSLGIGKTGVFLLQVLWMSVTLTFLYKLARLFTSTDCRAFIAVALTLIPLADFLCDGNQCEEWMLPFISSSMYILCSYLKNGGGNMPFWKSLYLGFAFAMVFYIRPNDAVMEIGAMCLGVFIYCISKKQYDQLLKAAAGFVISCVAVSVPIWLWFVSKGALSNFLNGMLLVNLRYTGDAMFTWGGIGMILIPLLFVGVIMKATKSTDRSLWYLFIPIAVLTVILVGKRDYYHYLISFTPAIAVAFAMSLQRGWKAFLWVVCVLFALFSYRQCKTIYKAVRDGKQIEAFYQETDKLFSLVPQEERNSIWNCNLWMVQKGHSPHMLSLLGCYLHAGITPGNPSIVWFQDEFRDDRSSIVQARPKWVVLRPDCDMVPEMPWIYENYEKIASIPRMCDCEIELYRIRQ